MRLSLRAKLVALAVGIAIAFLAVMVSSAMMAQRVDGRIAVIREHHIPRLELGPKLAADFETLRRGFQDAVAAGDEDALERTQQARDRLLGRIEEGQALLGALEATALRAAIVDYYEVAFAVSRRMIAHEGGESLVDAIARMQEKQSAAASLIERAATPDTRELAAAFADAAEAQTSARRIRLGVTTASLLLVLALSALLGRRIVRSLGLLQAGFERFGRGAFDDLIPASVENEFGDLAAGANRMAEGLSRLAKERERAQWVGAGLVELAHELGGDLEEAELAARTTRQLARYVGAPAAALYRMLPDGAFELLGHTGATEDEEGGIARTFRRGEGLVGEAALGDDIVVVDDVPATFWRVRSGLGDALPRRVVLVPIVRQGATRGVLEFASFQEWSASDKELLLKARETIAVALEVAHARGETRALLVRTQEQATRLAGQEETLRSTNEELQSQQEELRQTNEELSQQTEELEVQRAALEERNVALQAARGKLEAQTRELQVVSAYKSQFLANMSHELRTPLNSMLLLSNLLAENGETNLTERQVEYAKTIHFAGRDLLALINQVLDLAKVEAGKQPVAVADVSLSELSERVRLVFAPLAKERGLDFKVIVADAAPKNIRTDPRLAMQVLNNLLGNAIKFTDRGSVSLRIGPAASDARLRSGLAPEGVIALVVSDTGPGIAPADQERIFLPFEQVDGTGQRRHGGTGLGLNIARELAATLGGDLQVDSAAGKGATFTFYLPLVAPETTGTAAPDETAVRAETRAPPSGVPELLLIEDDPIFTEVVRNVVRERGLAFVSAADGASGLRLARERRPSGIILDVKLPDIDGISVMEQLRADASTKDIPVHVVSALGMPDRARALGATGYLTKPASLQDLAGVVASLVPSAARGACRILVVEDDIEAGDSVLKQLAAEKIEARRVTTARDALTLTANERFECLILDLSLPDMSGLELLEQLQARSPGEMPAIVIYTARPLSKAETTKLEAYAEAVVLKDGSSSERLLHEVRLFVRRLQTGTSSRRSAAPALSSTHRLERKRILVAEDDMRTVYALSATLRSKGAEVLVAENGAVALALLAENPDVSAVLMDVMMPEMDGYEAMRRIREQPRFKRLPIVALTAKAMKGDAERCLAAGATDYLPKPIDADRLLALLHVRFSQGDDE